jgi:hypothetical protein
MSALAWAIPGSEFADGKLAPTYLASLRAIPSIGGELLVRRVLETLHRALVRLNGLPRDDPFWGERNARPTLYKLRDFNASILRKSPDDELALWTQIALGLVHGSASLGSKQWRRLHASVGIDVQWPVLTALVTELNAEPTVAELAELVDRLELATEARAFLGTFDACGDPWIIGWRDDVLAALAA